MKKIFSNSPHHSPNSFSPSPPSLDIHIQFMLGMAVRGRGGGDNEYYPDIQTQFKNFAIVEPNQIQN